MRRLGESSYRWRSVLAVLAVFTALGFLAASSGAQDPELSARGRITYRVYCQNCHGNLGKGDGRIAELIKVKVADLTQLSKKNGGTFPAERVQKAIDGREEVLAHGSREMPIWGQVFVDNASNEEDTKVKIQQLVAYLESIQEQGAAKK